MFFEALLDDAQALAHLFESHHRPVIGIAIGATGTSNSKFS
jgi:hypothetical protein